MNFRLTLALVAAAAAFLLAACGGGGDDEDGRVHNRPVQCEARPELCQ